MAEGEPASDTGPPSRRYKASPPADRQGDSAGPPHSHTRTHSARVAGPGSLPSRRAAREGEAPALTRSTQRQKATPPGTPLCRPHSTRRRPARAPRCGTGAGTATTPAACSPHRARWPRGQCWAPTSAQPRPQHVGGGPRQPLGGQRPEEGERLASDAPRNWANPATRAAGGAPSAYTNTRTPARGPAFGLSYPRPTAPITGAPVTGNPHPISCS